MAMQPVDERIVSFVKEQTSLTFATAVEGRAYCAHCFYVFDEHGCRFIFKSSPDTFHIRQALLNPHVAGTVNPDKLQLARIRGLQFTGIFRVPEGDLYNEASGMYHQKYPYAAVVTGDLWIIEAHLLKLTDNLIGIGKKVTWTREGE